MNKFALAMINRIDASPVIRCFLLSLIFSFCIGVLNRQLFLNGFTILSGERSDTVIIVSIFEHWFNVFSGYSNWLDVNYFYPYKNTIAQTDAYFLTGLIYFPFRFFGLDPFISAEFTGWVLKSIGFIAAYFLTRKVFSFSFGWASLSAVLFTLSNGMTTHPSRFQLATVAFSPVLTLFVWNMVECLRNKNIAGFRIWGIFSGLLFGAWCFTCFYMAWFFAFFLSILLPIICLRASRESLVTFRHRFASYYGSVIFIVGWGIMCLSPFIYAFLPKSRETGVRTYDEVNTYTVPIEGILQVGQENLLFGRLYNFLLSYMSPAYVPNNEYYNTGFPPILFILFLVCSIKIILAYRQNSRDLFISSLVFTTIGTWLLTLNIFGHSAWFFVFHVFPGAKALRVISTYQIFLALPVVIIAVHYLSKRDWGLVPGLMLCGLLVAEQLNSPGRSLIRQIELDRISLPTLPPKECRVFYASGWSGQESLGMIGSLYVHNVTAMFLTQIAKIPTINGIASFNPPDWNFADPNRTDYDNRVLLYARRHGISNLCKLNLNNKQWATVDNLDIEKATMSVPFFQGSAWNGGLWKTDGLSTFEQWGTWSLGDVVTFEFTTPLPKKFKVNLTAIAFGFNIGKEFDVNVGGGAGKFVLGAAPQTLHVELNNPYESKVLTFKIPRPTTPSELGHSKDARPLGMGIIKIGIEAL
jgi:hypothetical protein